jgi:hypothetical protein
METKVLSENHLLMIKLRVILEVKERQVRLVGQASRVIKAAGLMLEEKKVIE